MIWIGHSLVAILLLSLHCALMIAAAPYLVGLRSWVAARVTGHADLPPSARWSVIIRILNRNVASGSGDSLLQSSMPLTSLVTALVATALVPSFTTGMLGESQSDIPIVLGLLCAAQAALIVRALDSQSHHARPAALRALAPFPIMGVVIFLIMGIIKILLPDGPVALPSNFGTIVGAAQTPNTGSAAMIFLGVAAFLIAASSSNAIDPKNRILDGLYGDGLFAGVLATDLSQLVWLNIAGIMLWPHSIAQPLRPGWLLQEIEGVFLWSFRSALLCIALGAMDALHIPGKGKRGVDAAMLMTGLAALMLFAGHF